VQIIVAFKKDKWPIKVRDNELIGSIKAKIAPLSGVPVENQKLMFKSMLVDTNTAVASGLKAGLKVMLIGTSKVDIQKEQLNSVIASVTPTLPNKPHSPLELSSAAEHKKIIDKGAPEGALPGITGRTAHLAEIGNVVKCVYDKKGEVVRLTFKLEDNQLWIGGKAHTHKLSMAQIRNVTYEPLSGCAGYAMLVLHVGSTDKSNLYFYFVPLQYCADIKRVILA